MQRSQDQVTFCHMQCIVVIRIALSAATSMAAGTARPRAIAVFRLMTVSYSVGA